MTYPKGLPPEALVDLCLALEQFLEANKEEQWAAESLLTVEFIREAIFEDI